MLTIMQFGATGQVGRELITRAAGAGVGLRALSRAEADLSDAQACAAAIEHAGRIDAVINAAAYTAVDQAETDEAVAYRINAEAPGAMARACADRGIPFLHVSTDYVFDGALGRAYRESDPSAPLGAYGRSKLAGEAAVLAAGGSAIILRTSWVFSPFGKNFVRTMLRLAAEREEIAVVDDQFGGPTAAGDIADALLAMAIACALGCSERGVFHFAGAPLTTWCGFAEAIFAAALPAGHRPHVRPIRTCDYPTPAVRPVNSALDCRRIAAVYGLQQPSWRTSLADVVTRLRAAETRMATESAHA
ncbi:MAG: dTDP-4-dehydrorhamnose reductase [Rhodospirillales bacterium]|nr:dTDP-4-dehydrorhamnose reductase [Rhodospirillales bacterium]